MRLTELIIRGFRSYAKQHTIKFTPGSVYILGENKDNPKKWKSNGSGKTSLIAAIRWVLYGRTNTGSDKDRIICRQGDGEAYVKATFEGLIVERRKTLGRAEELSFFYNGRKYEGDLKEIQTRLCKVIGISARLFDNSVWIDRKSRSVQFLHATPAERLTILEEILNESLYQKAHKIVTVKKQELILKHKRAIAKIEELAEEENEKRKSLHRAQADYSKASERKSERERRQALRIASLRSELRSLVAELTLTPKNGPDELLAALQDTEHKLDRARLKLAAMRTEEKNLVRMLEGACPTCKRPYVTKEHEHQQDKEALRKVRNDIAEWARIEESYREGCVAANEILSETRLSRAALKGKKSRIQQLKFELQELEDENEDPTLHAFKTLIDENKQALVGIQGRKKLYEQSAILSSQQIPRYKIWEEGFGSKGIRSMLLDDVRAILSHHVDEFTDLLCGDEISVAFPVTRGGFGIVLKTRGEDVDVSTLSEGEVWRSGLSILCALRKTIQYLNKGRLDLLLIDDPIGDLDEVGADLVVEMSEKLASQFGNVFMTLPRELPGIPQDSILRVTKHRKMSTIA